MIEINKVHVPMVVDDIFDEFGVLICYLGRHNAEIH